MKKIKIPKKFKKDLEARWLLKNIIGLTYSCVIRKRCILCDEYFDWTRLESFIHHCKKCPFGKLGIENTRGCVIFLKKIKMPTFINIKSSCIYWSRKYDKEVRVWIKYFKKEAKKYIEWV